MRRLAIAGLGLSTVVSAAAALSGAVPATAAGGSTVSFGVPRIVDPIHVYGEPDIAQNPKTGAWHASGPQGTGTQRSIYNISVDGGDSYRIVQNVPLGDGSVPSAGVPTKSLIAPGGGDTEVQIAHNGRAFFNDLAALTCFSAITTTDDGKTTSPANPAACSDPGADRQWMALFDPTGPTSSPYTGVKPLNYMEYQGQTNSDDIVDLSTDGVNYSHKAGQFADDGVHDPNHTPIIVDQHSGDVLGMTSDHRDANGDSLGLALAVGKPDAQGNLTFHYDRISGGDFDSQTLFPILTEDSARNLYAVWIDHKDYQVRYSWAHPDSNGDWTTWSAPAVINRPGANVNVFPWAAAGKVGILDVAWYGTGETLAQLGTDGPSAKKNQRWDLFFSQVTNAASSSPSYNQVVAAPHAMHYNDICLLGTACITAQGNRNQADFFKLAIGTDGRAHIIYTDSSNRLSQLFNTDTSVDHQGAALDTVVTQNTGLNALTGQPLTAYESTAPRSSISDPRSDALYKPLGGSNVPSADITGVKVASKDSDLVFTVTTAGGRLGDAATAANVPYAEIVLRWQQGDVLYDAGVEATQGSAGSTFFAGKTGTVDLCSVSGCKPNYMVYPAAGAGGSSVTGATTTANGTTTYTIRVPRSVVGNPSNGALLEEVMAFATVSPASYGVPLDNARALADEVPVQIEGTKTFNYRVATSATSAAAAAAGTTGSAGSTGSSGSAGGSAGVSPASSARAAGTLAFTGWSSAVPSAAVVLLGAALVLRRRRHPATS